MSGGLAIRHLTADEAAAYDDEFVTWPHALMYGSRRFAGFLEEAADCRVTHLLAERDGEPVGSLPFAVKTDARLGTVVNSLPWFGSHGGCWLRDPGDSTAREALLAAFSAETTALDPLFSLIVLSHSENAAAADYSRIVQHVPVSHRIGQVLELPPWQENYEQILFGVVGRRARRHVRKSFKQGFDEAVGDRDSSWQFLYRTHCDNMHAISGEPKPWHHFDALRCCYTDRELRLSLAYLDGEPIAALLVVVFGRTVEYLVPAIRVDKRSLQPLSFLIWHAMLDYARQGYCRWNWGGTQPSQRSLYHFKAGWGSHDHPYMYLSRARSDALSIFRTSPTDFLNAFPFFYLYPLDESSDVPSVELQTGAR